MAELVEVLGKLKRVTTVGIPKYVWYNTTPQSFLSPTGRLDDAYISSQESSSSRSRSTPAGSDEVAALPGQRQRPD
jgi:hypothetical protein